MCIQCLSQDKQIEEKFTFEDKFYNEFNKGFDDQYSNIKNNDDVEILVWAGDRLARYLVRGEKIEAVIRQANIEVNQVIKSDISQKIYNEVTTNKDFFKDVTIVDQAIYDEMSGGIELLFIWNGKKVLLRSPIYLYAVSSQDEAVNLERDITSNVRACIQLAKIDSALFLEYSDVSIAPLRLGSNIDSFIQNGFKDFHSNHTFPDK